MITLLNAAPDTGNQGVSALCMSAVAGLSARSAGRVAVADHGRGRREADWGFTSVDLIGLTHNRRYWRGESLTTVRALARMGGGFSATARTIAGSKAILDVSGGDSFTDLYGEKRFRAMVMTKRLALDNGLPLILLPQTLGPFRNPARKDEAVEILAAARAVWVRDAASLAFLKEELGDQFNPEKHRLGLDMAVALPAVMPARTLEPVVADWLREDRDFPVAGLNVSGLLCCHPDSAKSTFGLADTHTAQLAATARAVLDHDPAMKLLLVSHVHRPVEDEESDLGAALTLKASLDAEYPGRVAVSLDRHNAMELKWVLSRLDWFAGARMHATIGAFSSGVPTLGLGYSDKAAGVFAQCGIGGHVADLRQLSAAALADEVQASLIKMERTRRTLQTLVPALRARAEAQMDEIVRQIEG
ncbi:MAG: polysaccharide pyruvyl transferase family protein [Rhodobacterales bacterium]|nr:polysaccharide pyruvyl transferase family protein [Rhodobacterales bacterium]